MSQAIEELEKNIGELLKRYNKLKEENANLHKKIKEKERDYNILKSKMDENDSRKIRVLNKLTKVINEIEKYIAEEDESGVVEGRTND